MAKGIVKAKIKNRWKINESGCYRNVKGTIFLDFKNTEKRARFKWLLIEIPVKGDVHFHYSNAGEGKHFRRKRTKALLAKYRPFKKYVR